MNTSSDHESDCEYDDNVVVAMNENPPSQPITVGSSSVLGLTSPALKYNAFDFVDVDEGVKTSTLHLLIRDSHFSSVALRSLATVHDQVSIFLDNKKRKSVAA
jgi:hypothetical protein